MQIGDIIAAQVLARLFKQYPDMPVGSLWSGMTGWTEHFVTDGKGFDAVESELEPTASLSVLGLTGATAWCRSRFEAITEIQLQFPAAGLTVRLLDLSKLMP